MNKQEGQITKALNDKLKYKKSGRYTMKIEPEAKSKFDTKDPIYYNLTLNAGFIEGSNNGFNTPASFTETNQTPILFDSGDWMVSVMRCSIPTSIIPRYIFPIKTGATQDDYNLSYNVFTFRYATAPNVYVTPASLLDYQIIVKFQSEILNPLPVNTSPNGLAVPNTPKDNNSLQDVTGYYYFIYYVESLVKMFNDALADLWNGYTYTPPMTPSNPAPTPVIVAGYRSAMAGLGVALPADIQPFFTYDPVSQFFTFNAESVNFNQATYPRVEVYCDTLTGANTGVPVYFNAQPLTQPEQELIKVNDNNINHLPLTINATPYIFLKMEADTPAPVGFAAFQKIIFEVTGDIALKHNETDAIPLNFQQSTASAYQKPLISMLTDLEVDKTAFAKENYFIQYQQSSIEEVRLLRLSERSSIQNFNLTISWVDNYGNRRVIQLPKDGNPLTVKLAFYNKDFR